MGATGKRNGTFYAGLAVVCGATLMYEVVLTRLLSVTTWYYLAFVSVSMGVFGMTVGALFVQFRPALFAPEMIPRRLTQCTVLQAVSMPLTLLNMLAVPIEMAYSVQTAYSFLLFSCVIAVPFFFSGLVVCLALTRSGRPAGPTYAADLAGAAAGCFLAVRALSTLDAPSAMFAVGGLLFVAAALFASAEGRPERRTPLLLAALGLLAVCVLNASTRHGIQAIWVKGRIDTREAILAELWSPIACVRVGQPTHEVPETWGPSPLIPRALVRKLDTIHITIDHSAATGMLKMPADPAELEFLRYDVTSLPAELRAGGEAAIIGVGGGRDVLNAAVVNRFRKVVGIEINGSLVDLMRGPLGEFSGLRGLPGVTLHHDEGRSFLTRTPDRFDLIQASMVDTWAATSAGAMTLSENALYTVEGWRTFYARLKPGGLIGFSRFTNEPGAYRLVALARATLLSEGVEAPEAHLAMVSCSGVATLVLSNRPLTADDIRRLRQIAGERAYRLDLMPDETPQDPVLRRIGEARTLADLDRLRAVPPFDLSPVYDRSPFFFNTLRLGNLLEVAGKTRPLGNARALAFLMLFLATAMLLVAATIVLPFVRAVAAADQRPLAGGAAYFLAIGLGFMLAEIGMMQQLSLLLGHPLYSLVVVLAGLLVASGVGAFVSQRVPAESRWASRSAALAAAAVVVAYSVAVAPAVQASLGGTLARRAAVALALVVPCGLVMGFCAPIGIRRLQWLGQERWLPWMWALNGAASVLATFVGILLSMETSIPVSVRTGAVAYLVAAAVLPWGRPAAAGPAPTS